MSTETAQLSFAQQLEQAAEEKREEPEESRHETKNTRDLQHTAGKDQQPAHTHTLRHISVAVAVDVCSAVKKQREVAKN